MEDSRQPEQLPIINCHTHIFTIKHVPPYLAKKILPWPLWKILSIPFMLWFVKKIYFQEYFSIGKLLNRVFNRLTFSFNRIIQHNFFKGFFSLLGLSLIFFSTLFLLILIKKILPDKVEGWLIKATRWKWVEFFPGWSRWILIIFTFLFLQSGRNFIRFLGKKILSYLKLLPGKYTSELIQRYINLAAYSRYSSQDDIFKKLRLFYDKGTKFVVLPMDMEFMEAGAVPESYRKQLHELSALKNKDDRHKQEYRNAILPFIFVDPRRIARDRQNFVPENEKETPFNHDLIRYYIEKRNFAGIKIYPALGYFPFDKELLPLWRYACDNSIPIMTHCIRGTIFFRGSKQKDWDYHPVFKKRENKQEKPILLRSYNNIEFQDYFTHPLNYEILLNPHLLGKLLLHYNDKSLFDLFEFDKDTQLPKRDLMKLKICFGHFGGEDEWTRYLEEDDQQFDNRFEPIPFGTDKILSWIPQLWNDTSWFTIVKDMLVKYDNTYADISFIVSDERIFKLLRVLLNRTETENKILYGTDFYVVRQKKSEKQLWTEVRAYLSKREFDLITKLNPDSYLKKKETSVPAGGAPV
jgi:hypothetical protein